MTEKDFVEPTLPIDRRDANRRKLVVDVRFDGGDCTGIANTRDIGIGGLYMTTAAKLDIGVSMLMTISVYGRTLKLGGVVVYADPGYGVGVRFRDVSVEDIDFLRSEIELSS